MGRQQVSFEWHLVEDEDTWNSLATQQGIAETSPLSATARTNVMPDQRLTAQLLRGLTLCLAGLILVAAIDLTPDERERRHAITGISALLTQTTKANRAEGEAPVALLLETPTTSAPADQPSASAIGLVRVAPMGELTLAEVVLNEPPPNWRMTSPYRETRFYQETNGGWRQIQPDKAFWGDSLARETAHLRFEYLARDAATVEPLLEQLDAIYVTTHTFLGIALPDVTSTKLTIEITPQRVTGWGIAENRVRVTSPLLAPIPTELSASTFLLHQITSRMLSLIISQPPAAQPLQPASDRFFLAQWRAMRGGLRSWLQYKLLAERWPWDQQAATFFQQHYRANQPLTLDMLWWGIGQQFTEPEQRMWQNAAAESVIDYAVATYGPEILPQLWRGFHHDETATEWMNGVFHLTPQAFEAGWNQYLAARRD